MPASPRTHRGHFVDADGRDAGHCGRYHSLRIDLGQWLRVRAIGAVPVSPQCETFRRGVIQDLMDVGWLPRHPRIGTSPVFACVRLRGIRHFWPACRQHRRGLLRRASLR